ncbi:MAG TPA: hypothetical protein VGH28_28975 [Polyangiaceae bacterium]|jgi:hypothetical protein
MRATFRIGLCVFLAACGGTIGGGDDLGNDGGSNKDSSPDSSADVTPIDASSGGCPVSPPSQGGACSPNQLECEYGTSPEPGCNQLFECASGSWQDQTNGQICPPPSDCPATYASIAPDSDCSPNGLGCAYPEGTCLCTQSFGAQKLTPAWSCIPATAQCPSPRPDIGSSCSEPGQQCDYGGCQGGVSLQCTGGMWSQVLTPCPG